MIRIAAGQEVVKLKRRDLRSVERVSVRVGGAWRTLQMVRMSDMAGLKKVGYDAAFPEYVLVYGAADVIRVWPAPKQRMDCQVVGMVMVEV